MSMLLLKSLQLLKSLGPFFLTRIPAEAEFIQQAYLLRRHGIDILACRGCAFSTLPLNPKPTRQFDVGVSALYMRIAMLSGIVFEFTIPLHPSFVALNRLPIPNKTNFIEHLNSFGRKQSPVLTRSLSCNPTGQRGVFFPARLDVAVTEPFLERLQFSEPYIPCLLYTSPSPRDRQKSRMPSSA